MGKTRGVHETTPELRNRMVGMYEAGLGLREIAAAINCSQRTVKRWLNRFDREGTVETRERCGRKRATTVEEDEAIIRLATQTPITAAKAVLPALGLTCSVDTIRERLHKAGIHNWSPSRKQIQKIPLGEADGAAIQQAVWRPTGTQLGKKKSQKSDGKHKKLEKKKLASKKVKSKEVFNEESPAKEIPSQPDDAAVKFGYQQTQSITQTNEIPDQTLLNDQSSFNNGLNLVSNEMYSHPSVDIAQNWPLDLVQSGHHYPSNQTNAIIHEQLPSGQHLQELHTQREQEQEQVHQQIHPHHHHFEQHNQQIHHHHDHDHHQHHHPHHHQHHHLLEQQQTHHIVDLQLPGQLEPSQSENTHQEMNEIIQQNNSDSNSNDSNQYSSEEVESINQENTSSDNERRKLLNDKLKEKKKGGKAKGTLETSLEIRNRMIGMAEAGLSTLSIALTINRSERTVKRWLERWKKEGNVQTKERKGRKRITTKEQDEAIIAMATQNPLTAAKHVAPALGLKCSVDTIRERLHKAGIHSWKLGKKQGEGNAVHTIHLWQPSGNRPNKPKILSARKKKKSSSANRSTNSATKRTSRKKKTDEGSVSNSLEQPSLPREVDTYHNSSPLINYPPLSHNLMQQVHLPLIPAPPSPPPRPLPPPSLPHPLSHSHSHTHPPLSPTSSGAQSLHSINSIMPQRSDCRMVPSMPPPINQPNNHPITYSSCMINNNHIDQSDPLNYEPFIWTF